MKPTVFRMEYPHNKPTRPYRLAYLVSHPIQYQAPMLRMLAAQKDIDLKVYFLSDFSVRKYQDAGFGAAVQWDVSLLEGYDYEVLPAIGGGADQPVTGRKPFSYGIGRRLREGKFDALWLHGYNHPVNLRAFLEAKRQGIPVMIRSDIWSGSAFGARSGTTVREYFLRHLFKQVDVFLAAGTLNAEYYRHYGAPEKRILIAPYAVDNAFFQEQVAAAIPQHETFRASLCLDPGRPVILYASKFDERKHPDKLLEAYIRLSVDGQQEPHPYLLFVGDGKLRLSMETRVRELGWNSVRFLGFRNQTELPAFYNLCDVFVLVASREPWGLVVNEVMNAGRPVIVSNEVGAAVDLVREGENGFIINPSDDDQLTTRLRDLTSDPECARAMGRSSISRINQWGLPELVEAVRSALHMVTHS